MQDKRGAVRVALYRLVSSHVIDDNGVTQYLCRRYPTVFDLFVHGFLPARWQRPFAARLARYEMRNEIDAGAPEATSGTFIASPIVSGCFMLFRTEALLKLGGFDPRYFLYFEDYDLSLRAATVGRLAYVPTVRIIHSGGGTSRKGWQHLKMFTASAIKFFNRFGWRWF